MPVRLSGIDLSYLLRQVQIGTDYTQLFGALDPAGVREVDGANNNLVGAFDQFGNYTPGANPLGGSTTADSDFLRMTHTNTPGSPTQGTTYHTVDPNDPMEFGTSVVVDSSPRLITNLISSSITDPTNPLYNAAAVAARDANAGGAGDGTNPGGYDVGVGNTVFPQTGTTTGAFIGDQGVLGGATFNEFFVAFGQFFDHGLDFISKGGGFVAIPLSPNDPLYIDPSDPDYVPGASNIMYLNRASLTNPSTDFDSAGNLLPGVVPTYNNNTGFLIDQSQTYGSHASVNALLRQYDGNGRATGLLITSAENGSVTTYDGTTFAARAAVEADAHQMATWADLVFNAQHIGVLLTDADSADVPVLRVDNTGKLEFDSSAVLDGSNNRVYYLSGETLTQMATRTGVALATLEQHDPFQRDGSGHVLHSHQNMFADTMSGTSAASTDPDVRDPLLAIHYVSGDGRTNENVGLTAVHNIFHEEHNIQSRNIMNSVLTEALNMQTNGASAAEVAAYINDWTRAAGSVVGGSTTFTFTDVDGVAHALTVAGVNLDSTSGAIAWDGDSVFQAGRLITESEYNHIAINDYTRSLAVLMPEFVSYSTDVVPNVSLEFAQSIFRLGHSMLTEQLHFATVDSMGRHPGEAGYVETFAASGETDLFDAFLNPGLYEATGGAAITLGLLRQQSNQIDEFVTPALQQTLVGAPLDLAALNIARGRDVGLPTLNELRQQVYTGQVAFNAANAGSALAPYTSWQDFGDHLRTPESLVNFIAAYGRDDGAHDWGLNEARAAYQAGTATLADIRAVAQSILDAYATASDPNHLAAVSFMEGEPTYNSGTGQWEFGAGDQGFWDIDLWIGGLAERPTFDGPLGTTFTYIMLDFGQRLMDGDRFYYLYRMPVGQHLGDELLSHTFSEMIERTTGLEHTGSAFGTQTGRFILDDGNNYFNENQHTLPNGDSARDGHVIVAGLAGNDFIVGGLGDDYLYGDEGNDTIQGSQGNDNIFGGAGDDWIYDDENDDTINGGAGNDHIFAGPGVLDVAHGAQGDDEVHGGDGIDEVYGDDGNDSLFGEGDTDLMMGGEGNDYMNGGDGVDEMFGGNGNDWMQGNVGDDNINGGSGNDLLEGGQGAVANDGDRLNGDSPLGLGQTIIEWNGDGTEGDMDIGSYEDADIPIVANLQTSNQNGTGSTLMDTYAFLEGLVGSSMGDTLTGADANTTTSNGANNYLIGGGGNDTITGLGGFDIIVGDSAQVDGRLYMALDDQDGHFYDANGEHSAFTGMVTQWGEQRTEFADGTRGHVLGDSGVAGTADTAVYQGNFADYELMRDTFVDVDGTTRDVVWIFDSVAGRDDYDALVDIEFLRFADQTVSLAPPTVSITAAVSHNEGTGAGTTPYTFTVSLDHAYPFPVTVSYSTAVNPGSATAGSDFTAAVSTITIPANSTSATITVNVNRDAVVEGDETFHLTLTGADNGAILAPLASDGLGTIINDDVPNAAPTDINWSSQNVPNSNMPGTGSIASLSTVDPDNASGFTYALASGSSTGFSVSGGGTVSRTGGSMGTNQTYTVNVTSTDAAGSGASITESFRIRTGTTGTDTLSAATANDTIFYAGGGNDTVTGGVGNDTLNGQDGNDVLTGGAGNDTLNGGNDSSGQRDVAVYTGNLSDLTFVATGGGSLSVRDWVGTQGTDNLSDIETLRVNGVNFGVNIDGNGGGTTGSSGSGSSQALFGRGGTDTLNGGSAADILNGGSGNDTINAGGGNDLIVQASTEGRDIIDGGAGTSDTYTLVGDASAETFNIYSATAWTALGAGHTLVNAGTGIVVTRNGTTNTEVIAELRNVEELHVLTSSGAINPLGSGTTTGGTGDTINVIGSFVGTGLAYNTITVSGAASTVDITGLTSDHRVVLNGDGSSIVGAIRPQDVVNGNASAAPADAFVLPSSLSGSITHDADFGLGLRDLNLWGGIDLGNTAWRQDYIADHGMAGFGHGGHGTFDYLAKHDYLAHLTVTMDDWAL